jgi:hypothetical protein
MRRRRIGVTVVVLVVLLMIPLASGLWRLAAGTKDPPVISRTSPPPQAFATWPVSAGSPPRSEDPTDFVLQNRK